MHPDTPAETIDELEAIEVTNCERVDSGAHVELGLGGTLSLFVTATEETVSVVLARPNDRQTAILVDGDAWETRSRE